MFVKGSGVRSRGLSIDIRAADATLGYYAQGTFTDRLAQDRIDPAKAHGYREVWLLGPSMGGYGSLLYARARTADISGVLAIAPYLGEQSLIDEIAAAGGLAHWQGPARVDDLNRDKYQREIWRWLQAVAQGRQAAPLIFAGHGAADRLSGADSLLAAELPASRVFVTTGGHEWPAWRRVLEHFLDSADFAAHCR